MKAPKCRLCGTAHWTHEAHQWDDKPVTNKPKPVTNTPESVTNRRVAVTNTAPPVTNSSRVLAWRSANPDKYRAYMRSYMRKRRAQEG